MILAVIQARMRSTRLPGKVLKEISGKPMLWHVVNRVRHARLLDDVVVATSLEASDDAIADYCESAGIDIFRGSEDDVLDRFFQAVHHRGGDVIVRVTADCPLVDPEVIDATIGEYSRGGADYVSNTLHPGYLDGLDVEVFSRASLETAWREATGEVDREHVTPYIRRSAKFRARAVKTKTPPNKELCWSVDRQDDLDFVREVYRHLYDGRRIFVAEEVFKLLETNPDLMNMNGARVKNEGYYLSILREPEIMAPQMHALDLSQRYLSRAKQVIPSQTQTFSKGPTQFVQGVSPVFLRKGEGSHVWDVDGNEYIDFITSLGPIILGYNWPSVTEAVTSQLRDGTTFSLPHPLEVELAELLVEVVPCAEMVRFAKSGSDATTAAVRAARAFTGKQKIACCGYHGWHDWFIGATTRNLGIPVSTQELTLTFEYNHIESLERIFQAHSGEIAAVVMEPVGVIQPLEGFLSSVKEITSKNGALLVFDEVVTGFRLSVGGAQEYFGVTPDLACFGKAMANGFPLAAVVGRRDVMEIFDDIFFSATFGGETLSLAAAMATIRELQKAEVLGHLWEQGERLKDGYNTMARELGLGNVTSCVGLGPRSVMTFTGEPEEGLVLRSLLQQELVKRGVLFLVGLNLCYSHSEEDVHHTLRAFRAALEHMKKAIASGSPQTFLDGEPAKAVFRRH